MLCHIGKLEYDEQYPFFRIQKVALYDKRDLSAEQVEEIIRSGDDNHYVAIISKATFENVFRSLLYQAEEDR